MAKRVQIIGHTTANLALFAGLEREISVDTDNDELVVHTGAGANTHKRIPNKTLNDTYYQAISTLLTAIAAVSAADGLIAKTGAATVAARTITGTSNQISVSNGGGAAGNPTLSLPAAIVAPGSLATTTTLSAGSSLNVTTTSTLGGLVTVTSGGLLMSDLEVQRPKFKDYAITTVAKGSISGAQSLDMEAGNAFSATATGGITWTFSNPPATGNYGELVLILTNGGAGTQTWPTGTKWPSAVAPTLQAAGVDVLVFATIDAGTTWRGMLAMGNSS